MLIFMLSRHLTHSSESQTTLSGVFPQVGQTEDISVVHSHASPARVWGATALWGSAHGFGLAAGESSAAPATDPSAHKVKPLLSMQNTRGHL